MTTIKLGDLIIVSKQLASWLGFLRSEFFWTEKVAGFTSVPWFSNQNSMLFRSEISCLWWGLMDKIFHQGCKISSLSISGYLVTPNIVSDSVQWWFPAFLTKETKTFYNKALIVGLKGSEKEIPSNAFGLSAQKTLWDLSLRWSFRLWRSRWRGSLVIWQWKEVNLYITYISNEYMHISIRIYITYIYISYTCIWIWIYDCLCIM